MSLLVGEVQSSAGVNEPPRPLHPLPVYNKQLQHLENQDAEVCEKELSGFKGHLRQSRIANKTINWNWALPLVDAPEEARNEFFAALSRLLERQTSTVCRVRIFALLIELSAVEIAPPSGSVSDGSKSGSKEPPSFGHHALRVIRDIMPNVVGARELFISCVEDPLIEVLSSMSMAHLIAIFPLLLDILSDPYFVSMIRTDPDADNLFTLLSKTSTVFKKVFLQLLATVSPSDGLSRPDARSLVYSLQQCGRVLTILAQSSETAQAIHGDGVFTALLFQNWRLLQRLDSDERWAHDSGFHFFRLIGRLCRGSPDAAVYLSGGVPSQQSTELVAMLIGVFKTLPEKPNNESIFSSGPSGVGDESSSAVVKYSTDSYNASLLYCLSALLLNSDRATTLMKDRKEGMKTPKDYYMRLFKWIHTYENGDFLAACIEGVYLITQSPGLKPFKAMMEDRNTLCNEIHKIFKRLLTLHNGKTTKGHREALMHALELMTYYSTIDKIAAGLNHTILPDYDRLSILRTILMYRGESVLVDNDVKLAAARSLTQVKLIDLNKEIVIDLISSIKDAPPTMSAPMNACMTRMLQVAFRMAMFDGSSNGDTSDSSTSSENCGDIFRKEATEACAALYATLQHGIVDDKSPVRVDHVTMKYRLGMVKVLMTAWYQSELRQSCESRGSIDVMVKSLKAEQNALRWCKSRHERLIADRRCVDCEEGLVKSNFPEPSRTIPGDDLNLPTDPNENSITTVLSSIRCPRCRENVQRGKSVIQETYTPLYLEQTWSGHDIRAILETLRNLNEVDLVAFRVLHQGANILEGTTYASCVNRLLNHNDFDSWNRDLPGRSVKECQEWEKQNWASRQLKLRTAEMNEFPVTTANHGCIGELAEMQVEYYKANYNYSEYDPQRQIEQQTEAWRIVIEASLHDERLVNLVVEGTDGNLLAACSGGPLLETTYTPDRDQLDNEGPCAEIYVLILSPVLTETEAAKLQQRLLSTFSSRMYALGYRTCYAKAHRNERLLFSVARGVDTDLAVNASSAAKFRNKTKSGGGGSTGTPGSALTAMGAAAKEFLYVWSLSENVWRRTPAHDEFMSANGLQIFLDFVLKDTIKIHQLFTSTIRDVMEEFGAELQESLHRHAESSKQGGGAIRVPVTSNDDKLKATTSDTEGLDYEQFLPPPLPCDPYDLGDAPIASSGILSILNSKEDHLYKHLFPLILQNKFRADPNEHNRSEESPWSASLLGTPQENLLTIAANYASAASVYDESTWIKRETKKVKAKTKPQLNLPPPLPESIPPSARASIDASNPGGPNNAGSLPTNGATSSSSTSSAASSTTVATPSISSENDLLKHQAEGGCAAIFRACYTLVVSGSLSVRLKAARVLRAPPNFYKLRCLMASFNYGIRCSILQPPSPPYLCAMAINFMSLMEELLPETEVGIEKGLECLEIYEVFFLVIADLCTSLMSLLKSRNEHARDPMHSIRRLTTSEENVLGAVTSLCFKLIQRIQQLTLFHLGGDHSFLVRANSEARGKALTELLLNKKPLFFAAFFTFLIYDLEQLPERTEEEEEEEEAAEESTLSEEEEKSGGSNGQPPPTTDIVLPVRDSMRINIIWILSSFFHVSPNMERDFLHQYQLSLVTSDLGLRPSLLHSLLSSQQQLMARDKMYQHLMSKKVFLPDEFILDHVVCEHASSEEEFNPLKGGLGVRILILTNLAYYVSAPLTSGEEGWSWLDQLNPNRRAYEDIRSLTVLYGGQAIRLGRFAEPAGKRLTSNKPLANVYEVFTLHQLGLSQRILYAFTRAQRDDFGCAMALTPDTWSRPSLIRLYQTIGLQNSSGWCEKLFTHINIRLKGKMVPRVIVWCQQGNSRSAGQEGYLVILECDAQQLTQPLNQQEHTTPSEDTEVTNPIYHNGVKFKLNELNNVDFPETTSGMVLGFPEAVLTILFHDDAAREMWRVALKANFMRSMDASGNWKAVQLPGQQASKRVYATKLL